MTALAHRLPAEVWLNIYDQIQDKLQLAQCKLVCKRWTPLVERAMLKSVVLTDFGIAMLHRHLVNNPELGQHIHSIEVVWSRQSYYEEPEEYTPVAFEDFLEVAMTRNLKAIKGHVYLKRLAQLLQSSKYKSVKLEQLPIRDYDDETSLVLLDHYKETLTSMDLGIVRRQDLEIIDMLGQLKSLTKLKIDDIEGHLLDLKELDKFLGTCAHLKSLQLGLRCGSPPQQDNTGWKEWLSKGVSKIESVESLSITGNGYKQYRQYDVDIVQYLVSKYPNLGCICLYYIETLKLTIDKSVFENVETVHLKDWTFDNWQDVAQVVQAWKSQNNSIVIEYRDFFEQRKNSLCTMHIVRSKRRNHTKITIEDIEQCTPLEVINNILSTLGTSIVKDLEADLAGFFRKNPGCLTPSFLLQHLPRLELFKLTAPNSLDREHLTPLTQLRILDLIDVDLALDDFLYLAELCPSLNHLGLTTAHKGTLTKHAIRKYVHLPGICLGTLTVQWKLPDFGGRWLSIREKALILIISTKKCKQAFFARPKEPLLRLCDQDKYLRSYDAVFISIECQSLGFLKVVLGDINLELRFDKEDKIEYSTPNIVNSDALKLSERLVSLEKRYALARKCLSKAQIQEIDYELLNE